MTSEGDGRTLPLRAALGIDAAWTATEPSGVALALETEAGWRLAAVEASYCDFVTRARGAPVADARPAGARPDAGALLAAARLLSNRAPAAPASPPSASASASRPRRKA